MDESLEQSKMPPKRRGRPPKAVRELSADGIQSIPPDETPKKPRSKKGKTNFLPDTDDLARQLQGWHLIAAQLVKTPELAIDDAESRVLAQAIVNIGKEYDLAVSGKAAAWMGLAGALAMVYAPRAIVLAPKIKGRTKKQGTSDATSGDTAR